MNECQARNLAARLRAEGWAAAAYFEIPVDGTPERWTVTITKRRA